MGGDFVGGKKLLLLQSYGIALLKCFQATKSYEDVRKPAVGRYMKLIWTINVLHRTKFCFIQMPNKAHAAMKRHDGKKTV